MYYFRSVATAIVATILLMVTSACSSPGPPTVKSSLQLKVSVVASGLEAPWGLAFLPDGRALVSERDSGKLLVVTASGHVAEVQQLPAHGSGEGGLLGIALSPHYASDGFVYAYFSTVEDNRVVRFRLGEEPTSILTGIPVSSIHAAHCSQDKDEIKGEKRHGQLSVTCLWQSRAAI